MNKSENNWDLLIGCSLAYKIVGKNEKKRNELIQRSCNFHYHLPAFNRKVFQQKTHHR